MNIDPNNTDNNTDHDTGDHTGPNAQYARPVQIGVINWIGLYTLYCKEVQRFMKIAMQTLIAPIITAALFMMVFSVALGGRASPVEGVSFLLFLAPGLVMMSVLQNAFSNTSSSLVVSKVQGTIVDLVMAPLAPAELMVALVAGGLTRGVLVGLVAAVVLGVLGGASLPAYPLIAFTFLLLGSSLLSLLGLLAGIWAYKFDSLSAITNFLIQPMAFLSGTFYSVDRLPAPFHMLASANPFFMVIDGFRYGMIGISDRPIAGGLITLTILNIMLFYICWRVLSSGYRIKS